LLKILKTEMGADTNFFSLFFCDQHMFPLPEHHKFPLAKYEMVRHAVQQDRRFVLFEAPLAEKDDLLRVHSAEYVEGFLGGTLAAAVMRRIGFPWSPELVTRTRASVGGTVAAVQAALANGVGGTLAGGTHHSFRGEGSGFCVFNDLAVSMEWARTYWHVRRVAVIDVDVHQGDGTASLYGDDPDTYTLSLHGARNFPLRKQQSRRDIEFSDGARGEEYLPVLANALDEIWNFEPELVLYQAGVDTLASDRLGLLSLTPADLYRRDRMVLSGAKTRNIPIAITMGGGYSHPIELTVEAHAQTFRTAAEIFVDSGNSLERGTS
jgi:acetoin utilization deacetylase AcuC-like enzyme